MSQSEDTRLRTFEVTDDELLVVHAGRSETDHRTIFSDRVDGRYAIVPVDEIVGERDRAVVEADELQLDEMQIVGDVEPVLETGERDVELCVDGERAVRMDRPGAYGLLWVPLG